ncbi:MAG TPA: hypothetical protein VMW27_21210 [Thermoanaerobaculia bacterium]|nr:hypothetical protein [Thermoanaerobaculia bacterium]
MPSQALIMLQIVTLFGVGAGMPVSLAAVAALQNRYFDWIVTAPTGLQSPQALWETVTGLLLQGKFQEIGALAAEKAQADSHLTIGANECLEACQEVEASSECPHCPVIPE